MEEERLRVSTSEDQSGIDWPVQGDSLTKLDQENQEDSYMKILSARNALQWKQDLENLI